MLMLFPLAWMVTTSLNSFTEVLQEPMKWIPDRSQWINYLVVFGEFEFGRFRWNSVFVTGMTIAGTLVFLLAQKRLTEGISASGIKGKPVPQAPWRRTGSCRDGGPVSGNYSFGRMGRT